MSKKLVSNAALKNVELQELSPVLREITEDKQGWVYSYCDRRELGKVVYEDFIKYNKRVTRADDKYMFSIDMPAEGILSMSQAFQVIATTLEEFNLGQDPNVGQEVKAKTLRLFNKILDAVIQADGGYKFDATPYLPNNEHFKEQNYKYAYIDAVTWVMSAILSVFRLYIRGECELEQKTMEQAGKIYQYCIDYLIDSFIDSNKITDKFACGWNYTNTQKKSSPSLYFTFAVSELMIDILSTFENVIRDADIDLIQLSVEEELSGKASEEEIKSKKEQVAIRYQENRENLESGAESYMREIRLFESLNGGYAVYAEKSPYRILEAQAKKAAQNIWNLTKDQLATAFFASDLTSTVSEAVIEQSLQSDAVFNTIFIINTLINAGFDEDAEDKITYFTPNGSSEYNEALAEYDAIRDTLRIAYDNAYQLYLKMEKKKKAYKINEYTLNFDEQFDELEDKVNDLRKARIRVFSLMPLLVKTKTTLGEFLIQYPQYDMQIYLENILQYRCVKKTEGNIEDYYWTWERSGYSSSSNYYFFSALSDFFNYYEKYELPASENAMANNRARETVREEYLMELERSDGQIGQLRRDNQEQEKLINDLTGQIQELREQYGKLQQQFENDPLRKALNDFVCTVVREHILSMASVGNMLTAFSENLTAAALERVARKAENAADRDRKTAITEQKWYEGPVEEQPSEIGKLEAGIHNFGNALISERLLEMLYADRSNTEDAREDYPEYAETVHKDIEQALRYYLAPLVGGQSSVFTATQGYSGLQQILAREKANQKSGKNN